ncbi:MAG: helix-turn-helix domain-containing protein [Candidatus Bipolaricaulia bacterium]
MARKIGGYLRPAAAAQYLGIPVQEVEQMIESEELPRMKINGEWRVPVDQLEAWLDEEVSEAELKTLAQHIEDVDESDVEEIVQEECQDEASSSKGND